MLMLSIQQTVTLLRLLSISMVKGLALSVTIGYQATHSRFKRIYNFFQIVIELWEGLFIHW